MPRHIAIIMDGNGRWANRRGMPRVFGHRQGVKSVRRTVEECCRLGVGQLTLYCLSVENWKRPKAEIDQLMVLLEQYLIDERPTIMKNNVRLRIAGQRTGIPENVQREMDRSIELSSKNTGMVLCLAINYGGRTELVDAAKRIAEQVQAGTLTPDAIDEATIAHSLYEANMPDVDLLIRTAGEMRVSNFLLWQISYAEIWVTDVCWPDFGESELQTAIASFSSRERRFGGLNANQCSEKGC